MLLENIIIIPREMSLVDLVGITFSNWGKSEIPPSAAAINSIMVNNPFPLPLSTVFGPLARA